MELSADFAYVVGLITTDGSLSKDGRHINLTSKDIEQILNFTSILKLKNKISTKKGSYSKTSIYFYVQFGNVKLYRFLCTIGLHANKTKTIGELAIPDVYFPDFLRGHLDGDGFTYSYWDKRWKSSFMLYTGFVSASRRHLEWIQTKIAELYKIQGKIKYDGKSVYNLIFAKTSSIVLLNKIYYKANIRCLSRKRFKIQAALDIIYKQAEVTKLADVHA